MRLIIHINCTLGTFNIIDLYPRKKQHILNIW